MLMVGAAALGALGLAAYSFYEPYRYRVVVREVAVTPPCPALTVLHLADTHLNAGDKRLIAFLRALPERIGTPDLVISTGDMIEDNAGIDPLVEVLGGFSARLGLFYVLGSHDYYQSRFQAYSKYFFTRDRGKIRAPQASTAQLESELQALGWRALTNTTSLVDVDGGTVRVAGVDDPFLKRHRTDHIDRARHEIGAIGVVHAPDVVSEWALNGFDLVLAGHTHGGQVQIPFVGPLVTNCTLPAALGVGLNRVGSTWLHVSPGLGTGRFAPIRFGCRPEATLLRLSPELA